MKLLDRFLVVATIVAMIAAGGSLIRIMPSVVLQFRTPQPIRAVPNWDDLIRDAEWLGPVSPLIQVVEFVDYACGSCRAAQPTLDRILRENPSTVSIAIRHFPFVSGASEVAARAALCSARQGRFPSFHRLLLQEDIFDSVDLLSTLLSLAVRSEVPDTATFRACMESETVLSALEADTLMALAAGVDGAPTFVVDGQLYPGTEKTLRRVVEELLDPRGSL